MLIIASKPGQLGNRLLLFAQFVAIASERGLTVSNPSFEEFADFFETTAGDLLCRFPARRSPLPRGPLARRLFYQLSYHAARLLVRCRVRRGPMRAVQIEWEERVDIAGEEFLAALRPRQLVFMQGWQFDAGPALARRAPVIREFFRPLGRFRDNVEEHVRRAREGADVLVGVHVRHGDYRTFLGGKYFYELETYVELM
ncbi:MAG TPA: hypothetical protein VGV38_10750, partial [Pyrinomonadaceae bacterium]|nr:hypothetical protein [Pyrinomonadaceae bacterium]